jgi:hypothetical protein
MLETRFVYLNVAFNRQVSVLPKLYIHNVINRSKHVIPAKAGIQENTGFRVKPGMTIRKRLMPLFIIAVFFISLIGNMRFHLR